MEWIGSVMASLVLFLLVVPLIVAVGSVCLLGAAGWAFSGSPGVARTGFYCPFSSVGSPQRFSRGPALRSLRMWFPALVSLIMKTSDARRAVWIWSMPAGRRRP